ncbi:MAG: penicillin-binding protein [Firmicutes bacterium]|nr:penicillin-binding protein [Bacillota bacterium]
MKKIERRAIMCLLLAGVLIAGLAVFCFRYVTDGDDWATHTANKQIYNDSGKLEVGSLYDANGVLLMTNTGGEMTFSSDYGLRKALVHVTGDRNNNVATGANVVYADKLAGYNLLTGTYTLKGQGRNVNLNLDADVCETAAAALGSRSGTVGVYNYETGEIICLVSSPNYDPMKPPTVSADDTSGLYINRFFSASFSPGSIFKLVTAAASIENKNDYATWTYTCDGSEEYGPDKVTCQSAHGTVNLQQALSDSCNCYFGKLTEELGAKTMYKYVEKTGLTESRNVDGVDTAAGSFEFPESGINLAWAGIGQYNDLVNPCTMMMYMGAIANGGQAAQPQLIRDVDFANGLPAGFRLKKREISMIEENTADILKTLMHYNVEDNYGTGNFPGLAICAKSGTAEVGKGISPNAWFAGFLDDEEHPYAFIVLVEKGGSGSSVAGSVANKVLQKVVEKY